MKLIDNSKHARRKLLEDFYEDSVVVSYKEKGIDISRIDLDAVEICTHCKDNGYTQNPDSFKYTPCPLCRKGEEYKRTHSQSLKVADEFVSHSY